VACSKLRVSVMSGSVLLDVSVMDVEWTRVSCGDRMKSCVLVDVSECD